MHLRTKQADPVLASMALFLKSVLKKELLTNFKMQANKMLGATEMDRLSFVSLTKS